MDAAAASKGPADRRPLALAAALRNFDILNCLEAAPNDSGTREGLGGVRLDKAHESLEPSTPRWLGTSRAPAALRDFSCRSSIDVSRVFAQSSAIGVVVIADLGRGDRRSRR